MKKLLILSLLTILMVINMPTEVGASSTYITWSCADDLITGTVDIMPDTTSITVSLPTVEPAISHYKAISGVNTFIFDFREYTTSELFLFDCVD